jgi:hypothetical protein
MLQQQPASRSHQPSTTATTSHVNATCRRRREASRAPRTVRLLRGRGFVFYLLLFGVAMYRRETAAALSPGDLLSVQHHIPGNSVASSRSFCRHHHHLGAAASFGLWNHREGDRRREALRCRMNPSSSEGATSEASTSGGVPTGPPYACDFVTVGSRSGDGGGGGGSAAASTTITPSKNSYLVQLSSRNLAGFVGGDGDAGDAHGGDISILFSGPRKGGAQQGVVADQQDEAASGAFAATASWSSNLVVVTGERDYECWTGPCLVYVFNPIAR